MLFQTVPKGGEMAEPSKVFTSLVTFFMSSIAVSQADFIEYHRAQNKTLCSIKSEMLCTIACTEHSQNI